MKRQAPKRRFFATFLFAALLAVGLFQTSCEELIQEIEKSYPEVSILPNTAQMLWGFQILSIEYDPALNLPLQSVWVQTPRGQQQLLNDTSLVYQEPGLYELEICAQCFEQQEITIFFDFGDQYRTVSETYQINHQPEVAIQFVETPTMLGLDASTSFDPEGMPLSFTWYWNEQTFNGPQLPIDPYILQELPAVLSVSDGFSSTDDLVSVDDEGNLVYTPDKMKCTGMTIANAKKSLLNNTFDLGAYPAEGTQLPVDATGKLKTSYVIAHAFEVRATIVPDKHILDEGQDVARSANFTASDATKELKKQGKLRKADNRSAYEPGTKTAPFPKPMPAAGTHPKMVADSYDHHPRPATAHKNTAKGRESVAVQSKNLVGKQMIWLDQPGLRLGAGSDLSKGMYYKAYFRSWMSPDLKVCEKYFIVEIEIDKNGKVTKNSLTLR